MSSDWENGLPVNILRGIVPTATAWDGTIGYAYEDDGGVFVDETVDANDAGGTDVDILPLVPQVNDAFYFGEGFATSGVFNRLKIDSGQVATVTTGAGVWEYYDVDTTWKAIPGLVDETNGFQTAGAANYVYWTEPATWTHVAVNGQDRYWVRFRCTDNGYTQQPKADQIWLGRYPTSLSNVTDGSIATSSDQGTMSISSNSYAGYISFDLMAAKPVLLSMYLGIWTSSGVLYIFVEESTDNITYYSRNLNSPQITGASSYEIKYSTVAIITNTRYFRIHLYGYAGATINTKFYSVKGYELGA